MLYENACDDIKCGEIAGVTDDTTEKEIHCLHTYDPVRIGYSGQIKEYDEENFYGEIGEAKHRHISQLVALMPGTQITRDTPAWLDSARVTLSMRGDRSTGWALAHRLCAWARVGDGDHAYSLLRALLAERTHPNLWDVHPPFQIDGNFGAVAGITEMLLQSHEGCISLLPALPSGWKRVRFKGLKARGNFTVACEYEDGRIRSAEIGSAVGGDVCVRVRDDDCVSVTDARGNTVPYSRADGRIVFATGKGEKYILTGFAQRKTPTVPDGVTAAWRADGVCLRWQGGGKNYAVYRAVGNDKDYALLGKTDTRELIDREYSASHKARITYKIVCADGKDGSCAQTGALAFLDPASDLERERYFFRYETNNLNLQG